MHRACLTSCQAPRCPDCPIVYGASARGFWSCVQASGEPDPKRAKTDGDEQGAGGSPGKEMTPAQYAQYQQQYAQQYAQHAAYQQQYAQQYDPNLYAQYMAQYGGGGGYAYQQYYNQYAAYYAQYAGARGR
mmetsp:Transcript_27430/g.61988  ORF Transcript_27430/g.61988 Transcript_27430/m.61988 type:complete len:131 (+) Transcript_27430:352-744(+)